MKVVVIGSGKLGQRHLDIWSNMENVDIVGVIARNKEKLNHIAHTYNTNAYENINEVIKATQVDIIDICTPTHTHVRFIKQAARAKKHIICEKPLALNTAAAQEAVHICKQNNVHLLVGHTLRFFPHYAEARDHVLKGRIGDVSMVRMIRGVKHPAIDRPWYRDESKTGGLFVDLGVHDFDWLLWTFGPVESVMAKRIKQSNDQEPPFEYGLITFKMHCGVMAQVKIAWTEVPFGTSFELVGHKGMMTYDGESNALHVHKQDQSIPTKKRLDKVRQDINPFHVQLEHFLNCIRGKETPIITMDEAQHVIQVTEAIMASAETGELVNLDT